VNLNILVAIKKSKEMSIVSEREFDLKIYLSNKSRFLIKVGCHIGHVINFIKVLIEKRNSIF
jgi:hypothetical protein